MVNTTTTTPTKEKSPTFSSEWDNIKEGLSAGRKLEEGFNEYKKETTEKFDKIDKRFDQLNDSITIISKQLEGMCKNQTPPPTTITHQPSPLTGTTTTTTTRFPPLGFSSEPTTPLFGHTISHPPPIITPPFTTSYSPNTFFPTPSYPPYTHSSTPPSFSFPEPTTTPHRPPPESHLSADHNTLTTPQTNNRNITNLTQPIGPLGTVTTQQDPRTLYPYNRYPSFPTNPIETNPPYHQHHYQYNPHTETRSTTTPFDPVTPPSQHRHPLETEPHHNLPFQPDNTTNQRHQNHPVNRNRDHLSTNSLNRDLTTTLTRPTNIQQRQTLGVQSNQTERDHYIPPTDIESPNPSSSYRIRMEVPSYDGSINIEDFLDYVSRLEIFFDVMQVEGPEQVSFTEFDAKTS